MNYIRLKEKQPTKSEQREFWKHGINPILGYKWTNRPLQFDNGPQSYELDKRVLSNTFISHTNKI